jgi:uncharacterized phage protein (TIGR01671 family)
MREIKFRGKCDYGNEWFNGFFIQSEDSSIIIHECEDVHDMQWKVVIPETVGQFTGIKDKNGNDIYEGDILKTSKNDIYTVFYQNGGFCIESNPSSFGLGSQCKSNPTESLSDMQTSSYVSNQCVIIGNIHDNKELLK